MKARPAARQAVPRLGAVVLGLASLAATYEATPRTWKRVYARASKPGDTVVLRDGLYEGCLVLERAGRDDAPFTYRAAHAGRAVARCVRVAASARFNRVEGVAVEDAPDWGITISGDDNRIAGVRVARAKIHGILFACRSRDEPCSDPPRRNLVHDADVGWSGNNGVKFDAGDSNSVMLSRVHHSRSSGYLEGGDNARVEILNSEFDHNGSDRLSHGLYMKGRSGLVRGNRVHHNAGYGIHCWAACYGTPDDPYVIEENEVYENGQVRGSEVVVGGGAAEASLPNDGRPHHVIVRRNVIHDGPFCGLYLLCNCKEPGQGEGLLFSENLVGNNRRGAFCVQGCADMRMSVRRNTFWSDAPGAPLVLVHGTRLDAGALDGNFYWRSDSTAASPGTFVWNGAEYSLAVARTDGVLQNSEGCSAPYDSRVPVEASGIWLEERPRSEPGGR